MPIRISHCAPWPGLSALRRRSAGSLRSASVTSSAAFDLGRRAVAHEHRLAAPLDGDCWPSATVRRGRTRSRPAPAREAAGFIWSISGQTAAAAPTARNATGGDVNEVAPGRLAAWIVCRRFGSPSLNYRFRRPSGPWQSPRAIALWHQTRAQPVRPDELRMAQRIPASPHVRGFVASSQRLVQGTWSWQDAHRRQPNGGFPWRFASCRDGRRPMRLALFQPDIPQNTGAMLRLGACLGVPAGHHRALPVSLCATER